MCMLPENIIILMCPLSLISLDAMPQCSPTAAAVALSKRIILFNEFQNADNCSQIGFCPSRVCVFSFRFSLQFCPVIFMHGIDSLIELNRK